MESINEFKKGMILDINPLNQPAGSYREANNLRIINDIGGSSYSINNILGNSFDLTIPTIPAFQRVSITSEAGGQTLTINGQTGTAFNTTGWVPQDLYDYIIASGAYTLLNTQYKIYVGASFLVFVPIGAFTLTISQAAGTALTITSSYVPAQSGLEIIGSTTIRDDIYLFTTSNKTKNPGGHSPDLTLPIDASSVGQIWKYTYNKITLAGTLTLIYNGFVDFSTYYCIAPTATLGRYENADTQRIYWTDNFNRLRSLNVADANAIALDVSLLDVRPSTDFDIPLLTDIRNSGGASVIIGAYQCAYRLKNTGGSESNYSQLSNIVYVVPADEATATGGAGFKDYVGANGSTGTNKSITWTISNLDIDFERIEIVIVRREYKGDVGTVFGIIDEPLNGDTFTFTYDGTEDEVPITLEEFLTLSGVFTHCKTIGSKDNRLFVGNVRNQFSDISYDARAFRADTSDANAANAHILLTNNGVDEAARTLAQAIATPETDDSINKYSDATRDCFFKPNTAGGILGGAGANISYEFCTIASAADVASSANFDIPDFVYAPWRHTNPNYSVGSLNLDVVSPTNSSGTVVQTYPTSLGSANINAGFKYPSTNALFRGYQRNEIYRFGIQFFDKVGQPFFVKWIGDIKFPNFSDLNNNSYYENGNATGINDFRLSFVANPTGSYDEAFVQSLGILFTVNIPTALTGQISGYSIVRVLRAEDDKTVVSMGYTTQIDIADYGGMDNNIYTTSPFHSLDGNVASGSTDGTKGFYITPDIIDGTLSPPAAGMRMNVRARVDPRNAKVSNNPGNYGMYKLYDWTNLSQLNLNIYQMTRMGYGGDTTDNSTGLRVFNYDYDTLAPDCTVGQSIGNECFYFFIDAINYATIGSGKFLVTIERTVTNQYGGNTYTNRTRNEYMSCSHYRPVRTLSVPIVDTFETFGGDIYVNMYDSTRWAKNWGVTGRGLSGHGKYSTMFFLPIESCANADLRHGFYTNKDFDVNIDAGTELREDYAYNTIYSIEGNLKVYNPKPDPFLLNEEFDNRFYGSEIKINGEFVDSWGIFLPNNYWDVEGIYGPINAMTILKDKMYFWQDRAFGIIQINPRAVVTDINSSANAQLTIGTGLPLQRHDYLSTEVGLQHQWGITKSSYKLFWIDVNNKKFFTYADGDSITPESDVKGMLSWFTDNLKNNINNIDKPVYSDASLGLNGIRCVYDFKYNQAIFTITDSTSLASTNSKTIAFDETLNAFTSFYGYTPKIYFSDGYKIFSTNPSALSNIYTHDRGNYCQFYGTTLPSSILMVVNPNPQNTKIFDNILYDSESSILNANGTRTNRNDNTWNTIRIYNDYQNTDTQTLVPNSNIKRRERTWQMAVPRNRVLYTGTNSPNIFDPTQLAAKTFGERLRDKYIIIELTNNNSVNELLAFNNLRTHYRQSPR